MQRWTALNVGDRGCRDEKHWKRVAVDAEVNSIGRVFDGTQI